jgi:hypothetical protein
LIVEKPAANVSKKSAARGPKADGLDPGGSDCCAAITGGPNGIVYFNGDELAVLPFPEFSPATLRWVNGTPLWTNDT